MINECNTNYEKTFVNEVKIIWRKDPPYLNNRVIEIKLPLMEKCPNRCNKNKLLCKIYDVQGNEVNRLPNPVSTKDVLDSILNNYFPKLKNSNGESEVNYNCFHVNIIVFRGDFMIPQHFSFISEIFDMLQDLKIGMKIGAETIGCEDEKALPILLEQRIIDKIMIKLGVYSEWNNNVKKYAVSALNSLTQCIDSLTENIDDPDLEEIGITFLFDEHSNIEVFLEYLRIIWEEYKRENEESIDVINSVFQYFYVYLRGDGTEKNGIIEKAYNFAIEIFDPDKVFYSKITAEKKSCIFCDS